MPQLWRAIHIYCCLILSDTLPRKYKLKTPLAMKIVRSTFSDCADSFHSVIMYSQKLEKFVQLQHESLCFASIKWQVKHIKQYLQLLYVNQWAQLKELRVYKVFEVRVRELLLIGSLTVYCGCLSSRASYRPSKSWATSHLCLRHSPFLLLKR